MASNVNTETIPPQSLVDCNYFMNRIKCYYGNACRFRHCQHAIRRTQRCAKWPNCNNVKCLYRHPSIVPKGWKPVPLPSANVFTPSILYSQLREHKQKSSENVVGIFWDLENVQIPRTQKPFDIVQRIREMLVIKANLQEIGFTCYCDVSTISQINQISLIHANVRIAHVPNGKPGSVDRQILLDLDRFERAHDPPATIILITGDIDFVGKLSDLRHQAHFHVIVVHNKSAKEELKAIVNAYYSWDLFTAPDKVLYLNDTLDTPALSPGAPASSKMDNFIDSKNLNFETPIPVINASHEANYSFECSVCTRVFINYDALRQHQKAKRHLFNC
ncbi:unnamed protein product [Adineta ricciae]|uniref:Uncharacterized protein n=1 Tax=Adineta ricciae TaxID=249248 RepID=A0A816ERN8_ADIRI|nr:unnamed protein product [Adineta ricciae]